MPKNHLNMQINYLCNYPKWNKWQRPLSKKLPVAIRLSPGARIAPGGRMKQLFGAVV